MISGNGRNGLYVTSTNNVTVQGNFFGIGANNATPLGNRRDGILIGGSSANTQVGGVIPLGNVSAGNGRNGIEVTGTAHRVRHVQHLRRAGSRSGARCPTGATAC